MRRTALALIVATTFMTAATPPLQAQQLGGVLSTAEEIAAEFKEVPCKKKERASAVQALFERMGAKATDMKAERSRNATNLVIRGGVPANDTILIGAHYDFVAPGCGAVDNWSGIVALAHAYRTIRKLEAHKAILFVAFDSEEEGLVGSRAMADAIPKQELPRYCAMINIDSFGLALPFALTNTSSDSLMKVTQEAAAALQVPFYTVGIKFADADSSSFLRREIPAVTLSGLSNKWEEILHSKKDQQGLVNATSVYLGYRLALSVWNRVDAAPCDAFRENTPTLR